MEKQKVKVSIVISTYNYGSYLKKAIDSALAQDYQEGFEVIVVNDASTDDTDTICKQYASVIIYLKNERNIGYPATVNRGIRMARGSYICTLDADDTLFPDALKWYATTLDIFPFIGFVYGDIVRINELKGTRNRHKSPDFSRKALELRNIVYASSQMFRKECIEAVGGYDETIAYAADWDLWLRMSEKFCALHLPKLIGERSLKEKGMAAEVRKQKTYERCRGFIFRRLKERKLINNLKKLFRFSNLKDAECEFQQAKIKQALNQCNFMIKELLPRRVLVAEDAGGYLTFAFKHTGIDTASADKKDLIDAQVTPALPGVPAPKIIPTRSWKLSKRISTYMAESGAFRKPRASARGGSFESINQSGNFDLIVFWNILETFDEEEIQKIIRQTTMLKPANIALLVETKESYDGAYDKPTKTLAWWINQFSQDYRVVEPKQIRSQLDENNWFYNYGLDKLIFFNRYAEIPGL